MSFHPFTITLKNYRCFEDTRPLTLEMQPGMTALVGLNNSGKSTVLKFFYELRGFFDYLADHRGTGTLLYLLQGGNADTLNQPLSNLLSPSMLCRKNTRPMTVGLKIDNADDFPPHKILDRIDISFSHFADELLNVSLECYSGPDQIRVVSPPSSGQFDPKVGIVTGEDNSTYSMIQLLDTLRLFSNTMYAGALRHASSIQDSGEGVSGATFKQFDLFLNETLVKSWNVAKTGKVPPAVVQSVAQVRKDVQRMFGFSDLEINASRDSSTLQLMIDEQRFDIGEVGAGISQFIVLLANVALQRPSLLLLDEPELNLHASLQLDLLSTLAGYCEGNILFATHSLGLARVANARIFALRRDEKRRPYLESFDKTPHLAEYLGAMSFDKTSEIGFEKVLLVEGRTEVLTLQQWLRLYQKEHKVLIIPLGGSAYFDEMRELLEFKRICEDVSILLDSDREAAGAPLLPKVEKFRRNCLEHGFGFHVLERRATEHYLTQAAIHKELGDKCRALAPFENFKKLEPRWNKDRNWLIARHMTRKDLDGTDLGEFLERL